MLDETRSVQAGVVAILGWGQGCSVAREGERGGGHRGPHSRPLDALLCPYQGGQCLLLPPEAPLFQAACPTDPFPVPARGRGLRGCPLHSLGGGQLILYWPLSSSPAGRQGPPAAPPPFPSVTLAHLGGLQVFCPEVCARQSPSLSGKVDHEASWDFWCCPSTPAPGAKCDLQSGA